MLGTGALIVVGLPFVNVGAISIATLKVCNILAFSTNVIAVSIPGRMDGDQDVQMRGGNLNPSSSAETTPLQQQQQEQQHDNNSNNSSTNNNNLVRISREKTLLAPAGWAFTIWAPIYFGEALFCTSAQYYDPLIMAVLPQVTAPFVAANLTQSLWCASFRPSYYNNNQQQQQQYHQGWHKYVSVAMLGGTAFSLSQIPFAQLSSWYFIPLLMHFGWATAATLVNLNGSLAMTDGISEQTLISAGHASAVLATALGVAVTVSSSIPAYGLVISWALAACVSGMRVKPDSERVSEHFKAGAKVQKLLLGAGSLLTAGAAAYTLLIETSTGL